MQEWIIQVMGQYGTWGIFFLIFIENVFPPIPSEVILAFGGFMTLQSWALWQGRWCCMRREDGWGSIGWSGL